MRLINIIKLLFKITCMKSDRRGLFDKKDLNFFIKNVTFLIVSTNNNTVD